MEPNSKRAKTAIVAYRRNLYQVSPNGLWAVMELTRGQVDSDTAIGFVLRQEGYDITPEQIALAS
ncbi:MAG: hypothetical protein JWO30_861 [Fibrobacteres bacterium]|nr:hypothetical protein [Fibrobacterota bacterium]